MEPEIISSLNVLIGILFHGEHIKSLCAMEFRYDIRIHFDISKWSAPMSGSREHALIFCVVSCSAVIGTQNEHTFSVSTKWIKIESSNWLIL